MSYSIEYEPEALVALDRLSPKVRERIVNKINWLAANFDSIIPEPLTGNLAGYYKLRVGVYRVVYDFLTEEQVVIIDRLGHRRDVYDG